MVGPEAMSASSISGNVSEDDFVVARIPPEFVFSGVTCVYRMREDCV